MKQIYGLIAGNPDVLAQIFFPPRQQGSTGFDPTLALSINQDGLGRSNLRRVDSNLRQSLGGVGAQKGLGL